MRAGMVASRMIVALESRRDVWLINPISLSFKESMMNLLSIPVAIDVGNTCHWVAVGLLDGKILEKFDIVHNTCGFDEFFRRMEATELHCQLSIAVAMDGHILSPCERRLYSANELKFARYKRIFPT
jgi:hypothetical protein